MKYNINIIIQVEANNLSEADFIATDIVDILSPFGSAEYLVNKDLSEPEDDICISCNGTGEGMYDVQYCRMCGGSGTPRKMSLYEAMGGY